MAGSWDVAIVGGGAAGLAAAIGAARSGATVVIAERMPRLGKKILATGGGRCNLLNENLSPAAYSSTDPDLVASVFRQVGKEDIKAFFQGLGLAMIVEESRVFPATNQAATVLKVLELEVRRLAVAVELGFEAKTLERRGKASSLVAVDGRRIDARTAVLAAGGKSYPALGSNGSGLDLARRLGHRIITPVPSAVPLLVKDRLCQALQGQKIKARASAWVMGRKAAEAEGELLFTAYGLSGTAVLDVSEPISTALNRKGGKDVVLAVDLVPFLSREDLASELARRLDRGLSFPDVAAGILPQKFGPLLSGFIPAADVQKRAAAYSLAAALKNKKFAVQGTRGWNEAEFTSGGVHAGEISPSTLESRRWPGLFFAGEILDVQGPRGGYNLAWAWASGLVAGRSAAGRP